MNKTKLIPMTEEEEYRNAGITKAEIKNTTVRWHGYDDYNMNCSIEHLKKEGFSCSSYNNDLAPSYLNKKENIQVFFIDVESKEMKAESCFYKFSINKILDNNGEGTLDHICSTNDFEHMLKIVKLFDK